MRINRLKRINRNISFYVNNFGFKKPFKILIDGTLCFTALKDKLNIQDQLRTYLGNDIKLVTTQCVVLETERLGPSVFGAMLIVKQFPVHKCGHNGKPLTGSSCLKSMIGPSNSKWYFAATQDRDLQEELRSMPGVPLLYFHNKAPTLEAPSEASQIVAQTNSNSTLGMTKFEEAMLSKLKKEELDIHETENELPKKKRRKGGPNPLSCKKKKKTLSKSEEKASGVLRKKRRKRTKIPKHVKDELMKLNK